MLFAKVKTLVTTMVLTNCFFMSYANANANAQQETIIKEYSATARVEKEQKLNPSEPYNPYTESPNTYMPAKLAWANDGDSFFASINNELYEIRVAGVDAREVCPNKPKKGTKEKCKPQEFSVITKQSLLELCHKDMFIHFLDYDPRYNRVTSNVSCQGQDLASVMVYNGLYHLYEPYTSMYRRDLYEIAAAGKRLNLGIYNRTDLLHPALCRKNIAYCY